MLRCCWMRPSRSSGVEPSPNMRSKTTRGLISIGIGAVGVLHEIVFMYVQLKPTSHEPTQPLYSSTASSRAGRHQRLLSAFLGRDLVDGSPGADIRSICPFRMRAIQQHGRTARMIAAIV